MLMKLQECIIKVPNVIGIILVKITAAPVKPPGAKLLGSKNIEIPTAYIQAAKVITIYLHMNFAIFFAFSLFSTFNYSPLLL